MVSNTFDELDILSNSTYVDSSYVDDFEISDINDSNIIIEGNGYVSVTLNYGGKHDATEIHDEFSFNFLAHGDVRDPKNIDIHPQDVEVDNSSWFE